MRKNLEFMTLLLAFVLCFTASALGQETTGEIRGTIKDQTGAVVPNVAITIKGMSVGFNRTVQTDDGGAYNARQVPPGTYSVSTAAASGFAAQTKDNVLV